MISCVTTLSCLSPDMRYIKWMFVVTIAYNYNVWLIPLRMCFPYHTEESIPYWIFFDILFDLVMIFDIIVFRQRLQFVKGGDIIVSGGGCGCREWFVLHIHVQCAEAVCGLNCSCLYRKTENWPKKTTERPLSVRCVFHLVVLCQSITVMANYCVPLRIPSGFFLTCPVFKTQNRLCLHCILIFFRH